MGAPPQGSWWGCKSALSDQDAAAKKRAFESSSGVSRVRVERTFDYCMELDALDPRRAEMRP